MDSSGLLSKLLILRAAPGSQESDQTVAVVHGLYAKRLHVTAKWRILNSQEAKMETEAAQQIYRQRSQIAEFPHAWIKERCGLRQFRCRGRLKVTMEATWACLSYNVVRWFRIRRNPLTSKTATAVA